MTLLIVDLLQFSVCYKIRCKPMHPVNDDLPGPYVPVQVTCKAKVALRYNYAAPHCRTSQYRCTFVPLSVSLWNDLDDPVFNGVGLEGFKSMDNVFFICQSCSIATIILLIFPFSFFCL